MHHNKPQIDSPLFAKISNGSIMLLIVCVVCLLGLITTGQARAANEERSLAILPLDTSNAKDMAYLAPSIESMLKSRLTKPGMLKVMAAPDVKAKLAGTNLSNTDEICAKLGVTYILKGKITTEKNEPRIAMDIFAKGTTAPLTSLLLSPHNLDDIIPKITELSGNIIESVTSHTPTKLEKAEETERPTLLAVAPDDDKQNLLRMNPAKLLQKNITNKEKDETLTSLAKIGEDASKNDRPTMAGAAKSAIQSPANALGSIKADESERPVLVSKTPAPSSNIVISNASTQKETWWNKLMPWQKDKENEPVITIDADRGGLPYPTINELMSRYKRPEPIQPVLQTTKQPAASAAVTDAPNVSGTKQPQLVQPTPVASTATSTPAAGTPMEGADIIQRQAQAPQQPQQSVTSAPSSQPPAEKKGLLSWIPNPFSSSKAEAQAATQKPQTPESKEASSSKKKSDAKDLPNDGPIWQWY